ncbi:MAG: hypothetical protein Q9201_006035 [Fulgogasparrea decipioides]
MCYQYNYAGIEYGRECWCGDALAPSSAQATAESQCNKKCPGDATEICGAGNRLTLYTKKSAPQAKFAAFGAASADTSTTSSSSPSTTSGASTSSIAKASSSSSATTFSTRTSTSSSSSPSTNSMSSTSTTSKSSASSSSSSSTSKTQSTLYPTPSTTLNSYTYAGCANATAPLALNALSKTSTTMDIETCTSFCTKNNYGLSGLQNGDTCYCGNGLQSFSAIQQEAGAAKDSKCNKPCSGNATEICGADNYLSVWNATSAITIPPTTVKQVGYYPLNGCYNATSTALTAANTTSNSLTAESCVGYCATQGYSVSGLTNGNTCTCDKSLSTSAQKLDLSECNVRCVANQREFCGAKAKSLVYVQDFSSVDGNGVPKSINQDNSATVQPAP